MQFRLAKLAVACLAIPAACALPAVAGTGAGSTNGVAGSMPAYYDHTLYTINFMQFVTAQSVLLADNPQQNIIYQSDPGLPGGAPFVSVIDAIPADGMNPLWAEVQVTFNTGFTPRQLFSDDEINAAAASGEVTLTPTHEMYRCSVIMRPPMPFGPPASAVTRGARTAGADAGADPAAGAPAASSWGAIKVRYR